MRRASLQEPPGTVRGFLDMIRSPADSASVPSMSLYEVNIAMVSWETKKGKNIGQWTCADIHIQIGGRCRMIRKTSGKSSVFLFTVILSLTFHSFPAQAGQWIQEDGGDWYYEMENEGTGDVLVREDSGQDTRETAVLKGWNQIDGRWYCLDAQTGVWIPRPVLTAEAASYLLDNKLKDLGLYQDEEEELEFKVDYEDGSQLILSVGYEEKPGLFHRLNSYEIDRKKGTAEPVVGKESISLW